MTSSAARNSIVLIGFMGTGKSSIGRRLAKRISAEFVDTDDLVAARMNATIGEIFARFGEERFREEETEVLRTISREKRLVVSTGGGIVLRPENVGLLREIGPLVCLHADSETIFERVSRRTHRPLLQTASPRETMMALLKIREPLYHAVADVLVDTSGLSHDEATDTVLREVERLSPCRTAH